MQIQKFQDIVSWQKAKALNVQLYKIFKSCKDYYFKDQILRAALSIMNNIAEGYGRQSNKEFRQFLFIAKGSCSEVKSMFYLAVEFNYISQEQFSCLYDVTEEISKLLHGLIKSINSEL